MNILEKSDDEIVAIAKPIWDNLVKTSNMKDYGGFTKDFGTQMLFFYWFSWFWNAKCCFSIGLVGF